LVNSAYRGDSSRKGWTTEADLLDGTRITVDIIIDIIKSYNSQLLLYQEKSKLLGCVELKKEGEKLYLGMLTVNPTYQGKGIGKILLNQAENVAKQLSCLAIFMSVISKRKELISWYKSYGYTETGERKLFLMPDERWGIPKTDLEFTFLEKKLSQLS
jgi:ribosomal protein S18 acetylase RimI-like enzyme